MSETGASGAQSVEARKASASQSRNPVAAASEPTESPAQRTPVPYATGNVCAGDPLGPPRIGVTGFDSGIAIPETQPGNEATTVPLGVSPSLSAVVGRGFRVVTSSAEEVASAREFFRAWKAHETEGQKAHARERSTVFSLMNYHRHPQTGAVIWTQEQFDQLIGTLQSEGILDRAAAIWQDSDSDANGNPVPLHMHAAIKLSPGAEKSVRWISDRAEIPASRVQTPKESRAAEGKRAEVGPMAAERAFWDFCSYLTHEHLGGTQ